MKKTLIATAIVSTMGFAAVAQAAEVNYDLYGSLRVNAVSAEKTSLKIGDNSSRVGIKASTPLDGGLTGLVHYEQKVDTEAGALAGGRLSYIGVKGDFGTVTTGRQWTPQYLWTSSKVDILDVGSNPTHNYAVAGRQGNTLAYISPSLEGLQLAAVVIAAGDKVKPNDDDFDAYNFAANYTMGDLSVGAATIMANNGVDKNYTSVAASYTMDALYVAAEMTTDDINKKDSMEIAASFAVSPKATVLANLVNFEKGSQVAVEAQYKLGAKARVAVSAIMADDDATTTEGIKDAVAASFRVDF
ncbi:Outer membrane protein (porin) [Oceanospirillum multiglobuliferum]|uniref:Porin domain-containing protein n=1 Tax=Oceanospirillum multiglobuliferum TaxID=64969 RepID=A0A1T4M8T2_9GAMM|nr:porin [Oceanospirillum multiglobuliferum]OPX56208.1 hypothetical protein BTE48_04315 [Oceanospirillum multiglobuliferum]SJZ63198.1 Outer membrane protein (porin) [Oceanospirillum multiglobuliferum]